MPRTEHHDSKISAEEYLEYLCEYAGVGHQRFTDQEICDAVLEPNFKAQLLAIRSVLERNHEAEERVSAEIERIKADTRERGGSAWMEHLWVSTLESATFLDAAHSMAAVGLIAPLIESLFDRAFDSLEQEVGESDSLERAHERSRLDDRRKHHDVPKGGRRQSPKIAERIPQLAEAIDLKKHLPSDLERTLSVLFAYRNKMFHCGLEWPAKDLKDFANLINSNGWTDCFTTAESGGDPWMFYMSREFTDHCLETADRIIEGIGARVRPVL